MKKEESLEIIRKNMPSDKSLPVYEALQTLIPELAESEDEKIRKGMIDEIKAILRGEDLGFPPQDVLESRLAYLEDQKENTWSEEDGAKVGAMCKEGNLKPSERAWLKNLRNRVWKDPQYAIRVTKGFGDPDGPQFELVDLQEEQKPAWSEEDEKNLKSVISTLWFALNTPHFPLNYERIIELEGWLKSLRPQPKAKLTLLDENIIEAAVAFVEQNDHFNCWGGIDKRTVIKALHSLKSSWKPSEQEKGALRTAINILTEERSFPQTAGHLQSILDAFDGKEARKEWKPSEEQIMALRYVLNHIPYDSHKEEISGLLEQIIKL